MGLKEDIKKRPLASEKWAEVKDIMCTHLTGTPPTRIFRSRRPLESSNDYALTYREDNFQPITKQPFLTAVGAILEAANHIFVDEIGIDDNTADYLSDFEIKVAGKTFNHKDYILNFVGFMVEKDPNAVLAHIPIHPNEPLIPDFREELPDFNNITNEFIDIDVLLVSSDKINHLTEDELWYEAGEWVYKVEKEKEHAEPYFFILTKDFTQLAIPVRADKTFDYVIVDYYSNELDAPPFDVIGNNAILEEVDDELVEYHESTYSGAVAIANRLLGIESDSQILDTRFTYPEKIMHQQRCGHPQCIACKDPKSPYAGLFVNYDFSDPDSPSCTPCATCGGSGQVAADTSPLGTHLVAKSDLFDEEGRFTPLIAFVTPPIDSPAYMAGRVETEFARMERALFIMGQNMTNQSGEAKSYDWRQKVSVISGAVRNIYDIYQKSLNTIQGYLRGEPTVEMVLPPDFNIKTSQDITLELSEAQSTSSTYTSELTKELLLKKFGNSAENRRIVEFLELNDLLFGMNVDEVLKTIISYPQQDRTRLQVIHDKGFAVLRKLAQDDNFLTQSDEALKEAFDAQINIIAPIVPPQSPIA